MNFIEDYLGHHQDKNVIYYLGIEKDIDYLEKVLTINSFDDLIIVCEGKDFKMLPRLGITSYKIRSVEDILKEKADFYRYTLIFDHGKNILKMCLLSNLKTKNVVAYFEKGFDSFSFWEQIKNNHEYINISRYVNEYRNETLEWRKGEFKKELSVVLPVYNISKYLPKCLDSLIEWDADYVEFLCVNDGSTDDSLKVLEEYSKKDRRIKVLNKENGGCASARQYGLEKSSGRYVGFVDPDDFVEPLMFYKLLSRAFIGTYDISYSKYFEFYEDSQTYSEVEDYTEEPYCSGTTDIKMIDELISNLRVAIWRGIYKKSFLDLNNIAFHTSLRRFDDLPFKVETFARAKSVVSVDEPLYYYRLGRKGQDVSVRDDRLFVHFDIFSILDNFFESPLRPKQPSYYYKVKIQTHYWAIINLQPEFLDDYFKKAAADLQVKNTKHSWKKLFSKRFKGEELKKVKRIINSQKFSK